jgi:hypothetical protein
MCVLRGVATAVATALVGAGLLFAGGAASAAGEGLEGNEVRAVNDIRAVSAAPASAASCTAWNLSSDIVYVYSEPNTSSAAWGFLWGGGGTGSSAECAYVAPSAVWGARHNLCGGGSLYVAVYYWVSSRYVIAYVPDACVWVAF